MGHPALFVAAEVAQMRSCGAGRFSWLSFYKTSRSAEMRRTGHPSRRFVILAQMPGTMMGLEGGGCSFIFESRLPFYWSGVAVAELGLVPVRIR
jgi:hypothetical protein